MIDIRDLRVGNWVYNKHHGQNIKITPFDFFTHGHDSNGCQFIVQNYSVATGQDLEPIPLTAEILEKNDFKFEKNCFGLCFYRIADGDDEVCLNSTFTELEYTNVCHNYYDPDEANYGSNMEFPKPLELHQLQNILRDLGIDKELVI